MAIWSCSHRHETSLTEAVSSGVYKYIHPKPMSGATKKLKSTLFSTDKSNSEMSFQICHASDSRMFITRSKELILRNVSFDVQSRQYAVFVGWSGCGKSTVAALSESFYNPAAGQVAVDNILIENYQLCSFLALDYFEITIFA